MKPDGELTPEQVKLVEQLSETEIKEIDTFLLSSTDEKWRKVAMVVATTMLDLPCRISGIPDIFYSQRVQKLVKEGLLVSQGDLSYMRYSEVRKPRPNET